MTAPIDRARAVFDDCFGKKPSVVARAPGRVNIIGEHTDYNDGFVLPCAIEFESVVAIRARSDNRINLVAANYGNARDSFSLNRLITPNPEARWANYVRGMIATMLQAGHALTGADLVIAGNIPQGAGLSSSAALGVAVGRAFQALCELDGIHLTGLAKMAQAAECNFVGTQCGIMDQLVCAHGLEGHALLIDCRSLDVQPVSIPDDLAVMIVHSGISRGLVDGAYNERRRQCEMVARHFGITALRDLDPATLDLVKPDLDLIAYARARHVVTENDRVCEAASALERSDYRTLGELMTASHRSMRDDFEITLPAIDALVDILNSAIGGDGGARMTGGGFGGAVVALCPKSRAAEIGDFVSAAYRNPSGERPLVFLQAPSIGASLV